MSTAPVRIITALDEEVPGYDRFLVVNRADHGDANVVISFQDHDGNRDAIGIPPDFAIDFAIAIIKAAQEVSHGDPDRR